jgi:hypothetical protein
VLKFDQSPPVTWQPFDDWQLVFEIFQRECTTYQSTTVNLSAPVIHFTRTLGKTIATVYGIVTSFVNALLTTSAAVTFLTDLSVISTSGFATFHRLVMTDTAVRNLVNFYFDNFTIHD